MAQLSDNRDWVQMLIWTHGAYQAFYIERVTAQATGTRIVHASE